MSPTKCLLVVFLAWCSFVGVALGAESVDGDLSGIGDTEGVEPVVEAVEDLAIEEAVELVAEAVEPVVEVVEPVIEAVEPVLEVVEPVVEAVEPVVEVVEPVVEAVEPVVEVVEPVVEAVEPVVEAVEPVVDAVEPQVVATKAVQPGPEDDEAEVLMATLNKKFVQNKALIAELEEKKEQIGKIESLNELLRKQLEVKFSEATQLQNEIDEVTAQFGTHMQSSAAAIKDKDEKIQATATIAAASHNTMVELQEEMRKTEIDLTNVQDQFERQTQLVQTLENQRATLEEQRATLEDQKATQSEEMNKLKSEKGNLKSLHSVALEQVQSTREKLQMEAKRTADLKDELSQLLDSTDSKVKVFQADLDSSRSEKIALKESLGAAKREADSLREKIKSQDELRIVNDDLVEINKHLKVSKLTLQESVDGLNNEVQLQQEEIEKTQQKFWIAIAGSVTCVVLSFCLRPSSKPSKTDFDTASNSRNFSAEKTSDSELKSQKIITTNNSNNNSVTASGKKGKSKAKKA